MTLRHLVILVCAAAVACSSSSASQRERFARKLLARAENTSVFGPPGEFVTEYGHGPWEVVEVLPITARPGWVRVYAVFAEGLVAPPWDDEEPPAG